MTVRKSDWLVSAQAEDPAVKPCGTCEGSGDSGGRTEEGATIVCGDCRGFGY